MTRGSTVKSKLSSVNKVGIVPDLEKTFHFVCSDLRLHCSHHLAQSVPGGWAGLQHTAEMVFYICFAVITDELQPAIHKENTSNAACLPPGFIHHPQSSLAFKLLPLEGWVWYRALIPNPFPVEYKMFIILAESLKFLQQVNLGLRYIEIIF